MYILLNYLFYNQFCMFNLFIHFIIFASNDTLSLASQLNFRRLETCKREIMWLSHWALCSPQLLLYQPPFMGVIILFTIIAFRSVIIYLTCLIPIRLVSREIITEKTAKNRKHFTVQHCIMKSGCNLVGQRWWAL